MSNTTGPTQALRQAGFDHLNGMIVCVEFGSLRMKDEIGTHLVAQGGVSF